MYDPVADVLTRNKDEQLEYALGLLEYYYMMPKDATALHYQRTYRLSPQQATLLVHLLRRKNKFVDKGVLAERVLNKMGSNQLDVICSTLRTVLRKAHRNVQIKTVSGSLCLEDPDNEIVQPPKDEQPSAGDYMTEPQTGHFRIVRGSNIPWDNQEDMLMCVLCKRGSTVAEVAIALGRTARAVSDRHKIVRTQFDLPNQWG